MATSKPAPSCPSCGSTFRRSYADDGLLCKCGFEVAYEAMMVAEQRGIPLAATHGTFRAIPQSTAGIRVGRKFGELTKDAWFADAMPAPQLPDLSAHAIAYGAKLGLRHQSQEFRGSHLVVQRSNGERVQLERDPVYGLCRPHEVLECVERMVDLIANDGPGDWWTMMGAIHAVTDNGLVWWDAFGGEPHLRLRHLGAVDRDASRPTTKVVTSTGHVDDVRYIPAAAVDALLATHSSQTPILRRERGVQVWAKAIRTLPDGQYEHQCAEHPVDPLDVTYDYVALRDLLIRDVTRQREMLRTVPTPLQRDAVSRHWSAQLRAKVEASAAAERARRTSVVVDGDE